MLRTCLVLLLLVVPLAAPAAEAPAGPTHPFSVHDMLAMDRVSSPQVSPDGRQVVFVLSRTDLEQNRRRSDLWLVGADGAGLRRLTSHEAGDSEPRWAPDGRSILFLSSRSGSTQVWRIAADGGEAEQVTRLPLDVEGYALVPGGTHLLVALQVFPGRTPQETVKLLDERAEPLLRRVARVPELLVTFALSWAVLFAAVADFIGVGKTTANPEAAYDFARWMGFSPEGYAKRVEIAKAAGNVPNMPVAIDDASLALYTEFFPDQPGIAAALGNLDSSLLESPQKVVPGFVNARWEGKTGIVIDGEEIQRIDWFWSYANFSKFKFEDYSAQLEEFANKVLADAKAEMAP